MGTLKKHNLQELRHEYDLINYVETGTGEGECLEYAMRFPFEKFYSVEIYDQIYDRNVEKFETLSQTYRRECILFHGSSREKLPEIISDLDGPTLFFLDAHFPGADFRYERYDAEENEDIRVPLKSELEVILKNRDASADVFIIDDLWLYEEGQYEAGSLSSHLEKHFPGQGYTREKLAGNQTSKFIYDLFSKTHKITKDSRDQGYLILTPNR